MAEPERMSNHLKHRFRRSLHPRPATAAAAAAPPRTCELQTPLVTFPLRALAARAVVDLQSYRDPEPALQPMDPYWTSS